MILIRREAFDQTHLRGASADKTKNSIREDGISGAEDRARTGHPDLGKVVLYQMSYFRLLKSFFIRTAKIRIVWF